MMAGFSLAVLLLCAPSCLAVAECNKHCDKESKCKEEKCELCAMCQLAKSTEAYVPSTCARKSCEVHCTESQCGTDLCCASCSFCAGEHRACRSDASAKAYCSNWCVERYRSSHCGSCECDGCVFCEADYIHNAPPAPAPMNAATNVMHKSACEPIDVHDLSTAQCDLWCEERPTPPPAPPPPVGDTLLAAASGLGLAMVIGASVWCLRCLALCYGWSFSCCEGAKAGLGSLADKVVPGRGGRGGGRRGLKSAGRHQRLRTYDEEDDDGLLGPAGGDDDHQEYEEEEDDDYYDDASWAGRRVGRAPRSAGAPKRCGCSDMTHAAVAGLSASGVGGEGGAASSAASSSRLRHVRVMFDWNGVRRTGTLLLNSLGSAAELLEALVELGEATLGAAAGVSAAKSMVYFAAADGSTKKLYLTKTTWAELKECQGLIVQSLPGAL